MVYGGNSTIFELTSHSAICFVHTHYQPRQLIQLSPQMQRRGNLEAREPHVLKLMMYTRHCISAPRITQYYIHRGFDRSRWPHHHDSFGHERCRMVHLWMPFWKRSRDWITIILRLAEVWTFFGYGSAEEVKVGKDLLDDRYMHRAAGNVDLKKRTMNSISVSVIWLGSSWQECIELLTVTFVT